MTNRAIIETEKAPKAVGTYSQAVKAHNTVYISGQIPLDPVDQKLVQGDFRSQITQVFRNVAAVCEAANGNLSQIVKLTIYLVDLKHFAVVNEVMAEFFSAPYPARAAVEVSALPKGAMVEADAIMVL